MKKFECFWFEGSEYALDDSKENLVIKLKYSLDKEISFTETLTMPKNFAGRIGSENETFKRALKTLEMVGGISYFKTYLPKRMAGISLSEEQSTFWKKVYERGLGEFFYQNKIDFRGLINFPEGANNEVLGTVEKLGGGNLVAIGGGKDSIVSAEILKEMQEDFVLFSLRNADPIRDTAKIIGKEQLVVDRKLDPKLFELNEQGAWNGHVPITAYISCLMSVCAAWYGFDKVIMSLEKSSNFGQFDYLGMDINHQYSKSEEFEGEYRDYLKKYVGGIDYFSLLRKFDELKICKILSELKNFNDYAPHFSSCNRNFVINKEKPSSKWCGECPKCAFVYLCLAAFLSKEMMMKIFGMDLLNSESLLVLFKEILGLENFKPFECVGTPEESLTALYLISLKVDYQESLLVKKFLDKIKSEVETREGFAGWDELVKASLSLREGGFLTGKFLEKISKYQ